MDVRLKKTVSWILGATAFSNQLLPGLGRSLEGGARWGCGSVDELIGGGGPRYQVPGCDHAPRTVETPENGGAALPNSAVRTASS